MTGMDFSGFEDNYFPQNSSLNAAGKLFPVTHPIIMGILNITPDSFYAGSRYAVTDNYLGAAAMMLEEGAQILDIGGYSSRPGASNISVEEEIKRVVPVITAIKHTFPEALISIDTFRAEVAKAAVETGAVIVNDISGGSLDPKMFETVGKLKCTYVLMHMRGTPQTMQQETEYANLFKDMCYYFSEKIAELREHGVHDIILDPGFGFAKTTIQNFELMDRFQDFRFFGLPLLAGISRKSMIYKTLNSTPEEALNGTTALNTTALLKGAAILRVHDVKEAMEILRLMDV